MEGYQKYRTYVRFLPCHLLWMKQSSSISFMSSDGVCALAKSSASEHTQSASETCATPQWLLLSLNACGIICARSVTIASSCLRHQRLSFPKVESIFLTPAISASKAARHSASSSLTVYDLCMLRQSNRGFKYDLCTLHPSHPVETAPTKTSLRHTD